MPRPAAIACRTATGPPTSSLSRAAGARASQPQRDGHVSARPALAGGLSSAWLALATGLQWRPGRRRPRVARGVGFRGRLAKPQTSISTPTLEYEPAVPAEGSRFFSSFAELAGHYDAFTLDQYGVLHDGESAYPGAAECLAQLHAAGKRVVIISNYAGRAEVQRARLPAMGIDPEHIDGIITSGELAHRYLSRYQEKLGKRVLWIGWKDMEKRGLSEYFSDLQGYRLVSDAREADFVLVSGVGSLFAGTARARSTDFERTGNSIPFEPTFRLAIHNAIPMICANPDHTARRPGGWDAHLPGELAEHFKRLGGRVISFGKPSTSSFEEARRTFEDLSAGGRICHVGDSLRHDVAGAAAAGFDAAFVVRTGIHAKDLPEEAGFEEVYKLCKAHKTPMPSAVVPRFTW